MRSITSVRPSRMYSSNWALCLLNSRLLSNGRMDSQSRAVHAYCSLTNTVSAADRKSAIENASSPAARTSASTAPLLSVYTAYTAGGGTCADGRGARGVRASYSSE